MLQAKYPTVYSLGQFFEGLNFTDLSNSKNSWNLSTLKKTNYTVYSFSVELCCSRGFSLLREVPVGVQGAGVTEATEEQ